MFKLLILFIFSTHAWSQVDMSNFELFTDEDKVEVVWSEFLNNSLDPVKFYSSIQNIAIEDLSFSSQLRIFKIKTIFGDVKKDVLIDVPENLSKRDVLRLAAEVEYYGHLLGPTSDENNSRIQAALKKLEMLKNFEVKSPEVVQKIFYNTKDFINYKNGDYTNSLKLFLFCRHNRENPCLLVMKDISNEPVRNQNGSLWNIPALAKSSRNFPYSIVNGQTPQGVHTLDSVMPLADQTVDFGKWRRVILNWVDDSEFEENMSYFLPKQSLQMNWWKQASVARDIGRKWLRIHGTGRVNKDPKTQYYPHVPTSGCISTREGSYGEDSVYQDQRLLLDKMMESMALNPIYSNEVAIKGILYVIDLDNKNKKVTLEDLKKFGIQ